jgi:HK97 family phage major capsid protein
MARTDASTSNGWIPEPTSSEVLTRIYGESVVEQVARRVPMSSNNVRVPRFEHAGVSIVAEGAQIPVQDATLDSVLLEANKWSDRMTISVEDDRDSIVSIIDQFKRSWADSFAKELDNACLGVTAASTGPGTTVPFESVYRKVSQAADSATRLIPTTGALEYEMLNDAFAVLEDGDHNGNLVVIAHPAFAGQLRNLKDSAGARVVADPLAAGVPTIFGYELRFSKGARKHATATHAPTGNPLLIVGNREHLILGVRDGVESAVSDYRWDYDEREVKLRARRAFAAATANAFVVIEKSPSA